MAQPLMPKATAVWLVDNTGLSFDQIADFCGLHPLEVQGIADGDVASSIKGISPIANGQLTRTEIEKAEKDSNHKLTLLDSKVHIPKPKRARPRYTPVSRRQDRPNAILWLVKHHPELKDAQIIRLVGTTKTTIEAVRERTHWNAANQTAMDPVTLGLCTQVDLDLEIKRANKGKGTQPHTEEGTHLIKAADMLAARQAQEEALRMLRSSNNNSGAFDLYSTDKPDAGGFEPQPRQEDEQFDADSVFANLGGASSNSSDES